MNDEHNLNQIAEKQAQLKSFEDLKKELTKLSNDIKRIDESVTDLVGGMKELKAGLRAIQ